MVNNFTSIISVQLRSYLEILQTSLRFQDFGEREIRNEDRKLWSSADLFPDLGSAREFDVT